MDRGKTLEPSKAQGCIRNSFCSERALELVLFAIRPSDTADSYVTPLSLIYASLPTHVG